MVGEFQNLNVLRIIFGQYEIDVYTGPNCDEIIFEGRIETPKRLNLLNDEVTRHYHVIGIQTASVAKRYVWKAWGKGVFPRRDTYM